MGVELPQVALGIPPAIVVDPVGQIGALLDLRYQNARPDGVDSACGDQVDLARPYRLAVQQTGQAGGLPLPLLRRPDALGKGLPGDRPFQSVVEVGSGLGVQYVPGLGFALLAFPLHGVPVVGMDLDRQPLLGVYEFNHQGKVLHRILSGRKAAPQQSAALLPEDTGEGLPLKRPVGRQVLPVFMAAQLPALSQGILLPLFVKISL